MILQKMMFLFVFGLVSSVFGSDDEASEGATAATEASDGEKFREISSLKEKDAYITLMKKMDRIIDNANIDPDMPGYFEIFPKDPFSFSDATTFSLNVIGSIYPKKRCYLKDIHKTKPLKIKRSDLDSIFQKIYTKYFKEKNAKDRGYILSVTVNRDPNKGLKTRKGNSIDLTGEKTYLLTLTIDFKQDKNFQVIYLDIKVKDGVISVHDENIQMTPDHLEGVFMDPREGQDHEEQERWKNNYTTYLMRAVNEKKSLSANEKNLIQHDLQGKYLTGKNFHMLPVVVNIKSDFKTISVQGKFKTPSFEVSMHKRT